MDEKGKGGGNGKENLPPEKKILAPPLNMANMTKDNEYDEGPRYDKVSGV